MSVPLPNFYEKLLPHAKILYWNRIIGCWVIWPKNDCYRALARRRTILIWQFCPYVRLSICPSVCPFVMFRYSIETAWHVVIFSSPYGSPIIPIQWLLNIFAKFRRCHSCGDAKYRWGIKISRFSTNSSLYLANDTRYRHSYYGRRIWNHTQAFEWHQFHWPWVTSKPDFKVTILFNVK